MRIQVAKPEKAWAEAVEIWAHSHIAHGARVFVPAGQTPRAVYQLWRARPSAHLRSLRLIQIDDILQGPQRGAFRRFLEDELAPFRTQLEWITTADQAADVAILGVGVNGHIAFHEPGLPREFFGGCVRLSIETRGYLQLLEPTWGVTYGAASFLKCRKILVLARGLAKQKVLREALAGADLPIRWILQHPDVTLITDFGLNSTAPL